MRLSFPPRYDAAVNKAFRIVIFLVLAAGLLLRLALYFQNRNLIIDEANIVRNLAERGFAGLAQPLAYEQYAPPVFLWIEKLVTTAAGYGEQAVRFYPLLCGVAAMWVFYRILRHFMSDMAAWFPLALVALTYLFVRYSVELKQYMPDTLIGLLLILLALRTDAAKRPRKRFVLTWLVAGSLAVWMSMPSVFILGGVGCYYGLQFLRRKDGRGLLLLAGTALLWAAQFGLYYLLVLREQANSAYLQNYHHEYFLHLWPANGDEWAHNKARLLEILHNAGSYNGRWETVNLLLMAIGAAWLLFRREADKLLLVAVPILLTLLAAALKQFSLIDRVILFMQPLWVLMIGIGFGALMRIRLLPLQLLLVYFGVSLLWDYNKFDYLNKPLLTHEITRGLDLVKARGVAAGNLYIHDACVPTYKYYTQLHPQRARYAGLQGAHELTWDTHYTTLTSGIIDTVYLISTGGFGEGEQQKRAAELAPNMRRLEAIDIQSRATGDAVCRVWVYVLRVPD